MIPKKGTGTRLFDALNALQSAAGSMKDQLERTLDSFNSALQHLENALKFARTLLAMGIPQTAEDNGET